MIKISISIVVCLFEYTLGFVLGRLCSKSKRIKIKQVDKGNNNTQIYRGNKNDK